MRANFGFLVAFLLLTSAARAAAATPCAPSATSLCLSGGRFEVSVAWTDFQGRTGEGQAISLTADTGYFWFFNSSNIELIVKVLDARAINQKFWVFFGALSNVEYMLTVTDSTTGAVKRYQNPSGQFASVGDTTAFDGSSAVLAPFTTVGASGTDTPPASIAAFPRVRQLEGEQKTASGFTPCPETPFGFNLGGCRFHIEVDWDDGHGGTGIGHPVQLTDDTGYFWFFNDTNVELMMKVLDARPIDGNFWVFFGALSNVRYSVTVTDSVTKSVKRYTNPSGTFASVGDTSAFAGGRSVAPGRDSAHAVSADLDATGGSFSATGADGTVFTLDVPPGSLLGPETITLTPVSSIGHFPFSGGFNAGVEIEPEGLRLLVPATLTIRPASPPPPKQTYTYAYAKGGEDFILYPMLNEDVSAIQLALLHFSGYGGGDGGPGRPPTPTPSQQVLAPYIQEIAVWKAQQVFGLITRDEFNDHLVDILARAFAEVAEPMMAKAREECDRAEIELACNVTFAIVHLIQIYGVAEDLRVADLSSRAFELAQDILTACQQKTFDRCVYFNDPFEATLMLYIAQQLQKFGVDDPLLTTFVEGGLMERCLRFEIDFESRINEEISGRSTSYLAMNKFRAQTVPLRLDQANAYAYGTAWEGGCTLSPELTTFQYTAGGFGCTATVTAQKGFFNAPACWIGVLETDPTRSGVKLLYQFSVEPPEHTEIDCHGTKTTTDGTEWADDYGTAHEGDFSEIFGLYIAKDWDPLRVSGGGGQNGEFFAKKLYERPIPVGGGTLTEETIFFLKHTPDKGLPSCP